LVNSIPYRIEPRPDTGLNNVKLGVWLFLASEVMLFGGLFSAYFTLRAGAADWAPLTSHLRYAIANTMCLGAAGSTFALAVQYARRRRAGAFRIWISASLLAACAFLVGKSLEYVSAASDGFYPRTSTEAALYYLLTGVHALHVAGGILVTFWLALTSPDLLELEAPVAINRLQATALYWYFVDAIWVILLVLLYVV
jgi:heme/copper-type cytochrome/quinol oxidase subunit 3